MSETSSFTLNKPIHVEELTFSKTHYKLEIITDSPKRIQWTRRDTKAALHSVEANRIVGVKIDPSKPATFHIYWIPFNNSPSLKNAIRACTWTSPLGNAHAVDLANAIDTWIHDLPFGSTIPQRKIHTFINPFSGKGNAIKVWSQVKPVLELAHITVIEQHTTHQGHAEEVCTTINIDELDGIICVSGDGLLHEIVNGLLSRDDWQEAARVPIGIIPAGSGNGMAASLCATNPLQAALAVIRGFSQPLDVFSVITPERGRRYGALSVEWGVLASIDFDSESVRFLGSARFHIWALMKIVYHPKYEAKLEYLLDDATTGDYTCDQPNKSTSQSSTPEITLTDEMPEDLAKKMRKSEEPVSSNLPTIAGETQVPKSRKSEEPVSSTRRESDENSKVPNGNNNTTQNPPPRPVVEYPTTGIPISYLNRTDLPWKTVDDEFMLLLASNSTHLAATTRAAPRASLYDGLLDLLVTKPSRTTMVKLLMNMETGDYILDESIKYTQCKAFKLTPSHNDERHLLFGIDGEKITATHLELEVHPRVMRIFFEPHAFTEAELNNPHSKLSQRMNQLNNTNNANEELLSLYRSSPAILQQTLIDQTDRPTLSASQSNVPEIPISLLEPPTAPPDEAASGKGFTLSSENALGPIDTTEEQQGAPNLTQSSPSLDALEE